MRWKLSSRTLQDRKAQWNLSWKPGVTAPIAVAISLPWRVSIQYMSPSPVFLSLAAPTLLLLAKVGLPMDVLLLWYCGLGFSGGVDNWGCPIEAHVWESQFLSFHCLGKHYLSFPILEPFCSFFFLSFCLSSSLFSMLLPSEELAPAV